MTDGLKPLNPEDFPMRFYLDSDSTAENLDAWWRMEAMRRRLNLEYSMSTLTRVVREPRHCVILDVFETKAYDWNRSHVPPRYEDALELDAEELEAFRAGVENELYTRWANEHI